MQQLQHSLQGCQTQVNILTTELQHKCQQLDTLSETHKALLSRFQELTVLMSEAHNKLNTAVAKSGKAIAAGHTKVHNVASVRCMLSVLLPQMPEQATLLLPKAAKPLLPAYYTSHTVRYSISPVCAA